MTRKGILAFMSCALVFMSSVTYVVLMALTLTIMRPAILAAQLPPGPPSTDPAAHDHHEGHKHLPPPEEHELSETLNELAARLDDLARKSAAEPAAVVGDELEQLRGKILALDRAVRGGFDQVGTRLADAGRSEDARRRHQQAREAYGAEMDRLLSNLDAVRQASDPAEKSVAIEAALEQLRAGPQARPHQPLDPANLPFGRSRSEDRPPRLSREEFQQLLSGEPAEATGADAAALAAASAEAAALVPPQPEDTQENEDVQITPEIEALAASLDGDPLEIYRWVHDNVDFVPTYGSTQGSQMTLQSKRGNAFDIASLLIALLRSADVPARYVLGTVEIPSAQVMNWLGDVETPQVAQQVLGQGGIPNVGLLQGGEITHIRVEHVWTQAWVDYIPGRGAEPQQGDTWVPMDASFKIHEFTPPAGLFTAVPFDGEGLQDEVLASATVDEALGLVSGIDENLIYAAIETYAQDAGEFFIDGGLTPGRTALLGERSIIPTTVTVHPGSLPFEIVAQGDAVATLPSALRLSVEIEGFASAFDRALGSPSFAHSISLPALNSRRLGVTYEPATEADAQIIEDAIANGDTTLPLYLIDVRPVIKVDDDVVSTGPVVGMGASQFIDVILRDVGDTAVIPYQVIAGDEMVFGITANGVSQEVVQTRYDAVPSENAAENLHQSALHFWMQSDFFNALTAESLGVHVQRRPSVGLFSSPLTVSFLFGVPHTGFYVSRFMDVKRSFVGVAGEDPDLVRSFLQQSGKITSFLEGLVFDQLFSEDGFGAGFSAVDLIADANRRGIPTYFITADNSAAVLPLLSVSTAVKNDIANAVGTGKTVLVSGQQISRGDWSGVGYIVEDPETGAAGYLISGGLAGGGRLACDRQPNPLVRFILIVLLALLLILIIIAIIKSLGSLGPVLQPAFASILAFIAILLGTSPAYASSGGFRKGGQADPWKCPPPPPGFCEFDPVPPSRPHYPCPGDHWHYFVYNQGPAPACQNFLSSRLFGGCGPPPVPCPPC